MGTKQNFGSSFNRRSFLQRSAVVGIGAPVCKQYLISCDCQREYIASLQ